MTTLYIVRHGQCLSNVENRFGGFSDLELTDTGREQAKRLCTYMKDFSVDAVYSSDLKRAYETVKPIADERGLEVTRIPDLREINGGDWEMMKFHEIPKSEFGKWTFDFKNCKCKGGESVAEMAKRIYDAILDIAKKNDGKCVVIGTHATPVRTFLFDINDEWTNDAKVGWVPNASVTTVNYDNGKFTVLQRGYDKFLNGLNSSLSFD